MLKSADLYIYTSLILSKSHTTLMKPLSILSARFYRHSNVNRNIPYTVYKQIFTLTTFPEREFMKEVWFIQ